MELARRAGELAEAGAALVGVDVDSVGANAAITAKLELPFPVLSDPDGEGAIKPFGVWREDESRARPSVVALSPDGSEVYRYVGFDQADRPDPGEAIAAVGSLGLPPRPVARGAHPHTEPEPTAKAFPREELAPYFRGFRSAAQAIQRRRPGDEDAARLEALASRFLASL